MHDELISELKNIYDTINAAHTRLAKTALTNREYNSISIDLVKAKNALYKIFSTKID